MNQFKVKDYINKMCGGFPVLTQEDLDQCNALFRPYLFSRWARKAGKHHLWTSCCHVNDYIIEDQRAISSEVMDCIYLRHNERVVCPFCGKEVTAKDLAKAGKRRTLQDYRLVVFLHAEENTTLYAQAYVARKEYEHLQDLSGYPSYDFEAAYIFQPGNPVIVEQNYRSGDYETTEGKRTRDPFRCGSNSWFSYAPYYVIGWDAIGCSCMKYCQYDRFKAFATHGYPALDSYMMRYFSMYCLYPQVEMLMKLGLRQVVADLVFNQKKNAAAIDWKQSDPRKAFGLNKPELDFFLHQDEPDLGDVALYKRLKRHGQKVEFRWLCELELSTENKLTLVRICEKHRRKFTRAVRYLEKFTGPRCYGGWFGLPQALEQWKDYLDNAERLDYDLKDDVVFMPKNLFEAHDNAASLAAREQAEKDAMEIRELTEKLDRRYSFQLAGYHIRPPMSTAEIVAEGQALKHCVGGYADRHAKGITTILFLRSDGDPWKPLVTIEMNGRHLVQIHGYRNERDGAESPRKRYAAIVEPWLNWVEAGSKRDKDGKPILPRKQKEVKTA